MGEIMQINIEWDGGYSVDEVRNFQGDSDYGLYQVYGVHPIYGSDVLLYLGKASQQCFGTRIPQHDKWAYDPDVNSLRVYLGRLGGNKAVSNTRWDKQISIAEKLLIFTHKPAYNASNIRSISNVGICTHILNWGSYRSLMPEVSAFRYLCDDEEHYSNFRIYGE